MKWVDVLSFVEWFVEVDPEGKGVEPNFGQLRHWSVVPFVFDSDTVGRPLKENTELGILRDLCKGPMCRIIIDDEGHCTITLREEVRARVDTIREYAAQEDKDVRMAELAALWAQEAELLDIIGEDEGVAAPVVANESLLRLLKAMSQAGDVEVDTADLDAVYAMYSA